MSYPVLTDQIPVHRQSSGGICSIASVSEPITEAPPSTSYTFPVLIRAISSGVNSGAGIFPKARTSPAQIGDSVMKVFLLNELLRAALFDNIETISAALLRRTIS